MLSIHDTDSWIEVSSQPSSSSLSSATEEAANGLRTLHDSNIRRRRQLADIRTGLQTARRSRSAEASSQEEYEESESESDRVMTSSNEGLAMPRGTRDSRVVPPSSASSDNMGDAEDDDNDDDENATAVNGARGYPPPFQPQPNAFNRPAPSQSDRPGMFRQGTATYPYAERSRPALRGNSQRHSYPAQPTQHSPFNAISPSYQADQDAALRASLSTLLSCAAAARGLPKSGMTNASAPAPSSRVGPSALRIVPESVVLGGPSSSATPSSARATTGSSSGEPAAMGTQAPPRARSSDKSKRSSAMESKDRRATKKRRSSAGPGFGAATAAAAAQAGYASASYGVGEVSPTLLTWVVSAGVVVLVGALSFSAGYTMGKEVGRAEVGGASCGREVMVSRGSGGTLRRLRWGDALTA